MQIPDESKIITAPPNMADFVLRARSLIVLSFYLVTAFYSVICSDANLAYRRTIEANTTCGSPPEEYLKTWQDIFRPGNRVAYICNASSPNFSHPPRFMVDGSHDTHWQAKSDSDPANITIDLRSSTQKFVFVRTINIQFGAYQRPGQILYSKSMDGGLTYSPWHYYVTYPSECSSIFGVRYADRPFLENSVLCRTFQPSLLPLKGNETVALDIYGGRSSRNSRILQQWMNATNVKIQFSGLFKKFDIFSLKWHHYTVREINVTGSCFCNGHASVCNINATSGDRVCKCANNACGPLCDQCCPAYNQYPWKQGNGAPFEVDRTAACQPCNCHSHSSSCVYNETVASAGLSLNSTGFYSGGGVCQDCQHNTTGINCEKCIALFYRPAGKTRLGVNACSECNCSSLGSRAVPGVPYLDCIRDETVNRTGMAAGDCYCKQNVHNRKCDVCKPTFYNLSSSNPQGCQDCLCHTAGTVNASNICTGDHLGNCPCKNNTESRACNVCKDTFYNLTAVNSNGCQDCSCDPGGRSSPVCNKTSGLCRCKSTNITGRMCDRPRDGFYFPSLHYLTFPMNRISSAGHRGSIQLPTFKNGSGVFYTIFKYKSAILSRNSDVTLAVPDSKKELRGTIDLLSTCTRGCYAMVAQNFTLIEAKSWNVFLAVKGLSASDAASIQIDSVIVLPSEFYHARVLGPRRNYFVSNCDIIRSNFSKNGSLDRNCVDSVFSLTMGLIGDPFGCGCNVTGSQDNVCAKYEGQCKCKPGVTGRKCDACLPGYFNFTSNGCTACNCSGDNKICNAVTGQCTCPRNTVGRTCGECANLYWGWNSTTGCTSCNCNSTGSSSLQCDLTRGNCSCKYGIGADKCDSCLDDYTGFSASGCSQCNCSINGSLSTACSKTTGECSCKANTVNRTCDQCSSTSFHLSGTNRYGCLSCVCMGITKICSSTQGYYTQEQLSRYGWRVGNETHLLGISHSNSTIGSGRQSIPAIMATIPTQTRPVYWTAPRTFTQKSLVHSYGGFLQFSLTYSINSGSALVRTQQAVLKGSSVAIYQNMSMTFASVINVRRLRMHEDSWHHANGSRVSRSTFLLILAKPSSFLLSASSYQSTSGSYSTRIGGLSISNTQSNVSEVGRALQVEQCQCGAGYSGSSCERCAVGYKRARGRSHPYLGICVPCQCNSHSGVCDPDTGKCLDCQHNTTGDFCQQCLPGFYGNATVGTNSDCQRCPCEAPRTQSSLCEDRNGTATCLNCSQGYNGASCDRCSLGYYGQPMQPRGRCQSCRCSNNSDVCNTTSGVCLNCLFNTSGDHCERCKDGWFGDALLRTCQGCNCNATGSVSNVCNHTSGVCDCRANVNGTKCTTCQPNSYGFNSTGCKLCNCNPFGSVKPQCNESGICECRNNTLGKRCNACTAGYFGLPLQSCQGCDCNVTGSRNSSCATTTGRCFCQIGVQGRQCSSCKKQYINFTETGCSACGSCSMLLQRKVNTEYSNIQKAHVDLQTLRLMSNLTSSLTRTELMHNSTQVAKTQFDSRMAVLQAGINRIKSDSLSRSVNSLNRRANQLVGRSVLLSNTSSSELLRIQSIRSQAETAARLVISVNNSLDAIITNLRALKSGADSMLSNAQGLNFNFTFQKELGFAQSNASVALAILVRMQSSLANATVQKRQVDAIGTNVSVLMATKDRQKENVTSLQNKVAAQQKRLDLLLTDITNVRAILQATNATVANISIDFNSLEAVTSNISNVLRETQSVLQSANDTINNATGLRNSFDNLSRLVRDVQTNLSSARSLTNEASSHASNLTAQANNLTSTFAGAKVHGANAVNAVERYQSISRLINQSLELSSQANRSVQEVLRVLQQPGNQNLTRKASTSLDRSRQTLAQAIGQRNNLKGLQQNVSLSNDTYQSVKRTGHMVSSRFNTLLALVNSLSVTAEYGSRPHSLERSSSLVDSQSSNITSASYRAITESRGLRVNITEMAAVVRNINSTSKAATSNLKQAWDTVNNVTSKLESSQNSPMDNINNITRLIQQFNTSKVTVDNRLASIQSKLAALKQRIGRMQTAIRLNGSNSVRYRPPLTAFVSSAYSQMQMDFKTTQRNALLMHFGNTSTASTTDKMSLKIVDTKVVFEYTVNGQKRSVTNWAVGVSDGFWRRAFATRQGDYSRLTVSVLASNYSRTYSSYIGADSASMRLTDTASLFLGALPPTEMINATALPFSGCIDNVILNKDHVSLWNYTTATHKPGFCNASQVVVPSLPTISGTSFSGNGFAQLKMGNFSIRNYSRIELDFRTLHGNGTLFAVKSARNVLVYSVILQNGNVFVLTNNARFRSRANTQSRGSYADGNSYRAIIERSTNHFTLSVTSVATGTGPAPEKVNSSLPLLEEGTAVFFGGVNASELGQLNTGQYFAGCISNIRLSNNGTGGMDSIRLNDARLLLYSKGTTFGRCLAQIQNGVRFLGNGYASAATPSQFLRTLLIEFRSTDPNGVLFYSEYQGAKFYIALYHGNIFLDYKNSSRNARNNLYTRTQTLNSGQYHTLSVIFSDTTLISVSVDGTSQNQQLQSGLAPSVQLNGLIYFGGVPTWIFADTSNSAVEFPVTASFKGDFRRVLVNKIDYMKLMIPRSTAVSLAGVPLLQVISPTPRPTTPPPTTLPPTCAAGKSGPQYDGNAKQVGIHTAFSTLALRSNNQLILSYLKVNFLLTLEFRAFSSYGVVFFASNTTTRQFISLELVNGKLVYQFNSGGGLVKMSTTRNYALGQWVKVYLLRMSQFGAMLIAKTKEYQNMRHGNGMQEMHIDYPFYFGSIPSGISLTMLQNPSGRNSFRGCIKDFQVQDPTQNHVFDLTAHRDASSSRNISRCYASVLPTLRVTGNGYTPAERNLVTSASFSVSMRFRTSQRNGILWHLVGKTPGVSLLLEQNLGQLILAYTNVGTRRIAWVDPSIAFNRGANMSYFICNNAFHTVVVARSGSNFTIAVDSYPVFAAALGSAAVNGTLFVGGSPSELRPGLTGCIQSLIVNGKANDLVTSVSSPEARFVNTGCSGS